jgi:hypothetical protein
MLYTFIKLALSAGLLWAVGWASKQSALLGGLFASLPLLSILAMLWLYHESKSPLAVAELSQAIFYMVLPSLLLFVALPFLLKRNVPFYAALLASCTLTVAAYALVYWLVLRFRVR